MRPRRYGHAVFLICSHVATSLDGRLRPCQLPQSWGRGTIIIKGRRTNYIRRVCPPSHRCSGAYLTLHPWGCSSRHVGSCSNEHGAETCQGRARHGFSDMMGFKHALQQWLASWGFVMHHNGRKHETSISDIYRIFFSKNQIYINNLSNYYIKTRNLINQVNILLIFLL